MTSLFFAALIFAQAQVETLKYIATDEKIKLNMELFCSGWPLTGSNYRLAIDPEKEILSDLVKDKLGQVIASCPKLIEYTTDEKAPQLFLTTIEQFNEGRANCFYGHSTVCTTKILP